MKIYLIRHGKTKGNMEKRYVGSTDEGLCSSGVAEIKCLRERYEHCIGKPNQIVISPMRRCVETGELLFPSARQLSVDEFKECNFGEFEYKNYVELTGNPYYEKWLESGGSIAFPGGESKEEFQERVVERFRELLVGGRLKLEALEDKKGGAKEDRIVLMVHGGTIMSILDRFSEPHKDYYDWQVENGHGYVGDLLLDDKKVVIKNIEKL